MRGVQEKEKEKGNKKGQETSQERTRKKGNRRMNAEPPPSERIGRRSSWRCGPVHVVYVPRTPPPTTYIVLVVYNLRAAAQQCQRGDARAGKKDPTTTFILFYLRIHYIT